MPTLHSRRAGLTLIELLLVLSVLGVLAAVVIPQFRGFAETAAESNIQAQLQSLRAQLEIFRLRNEEGEYPNLIDDQWQTMLDGDLLACPPRNPYQGNSTLVALDAAEGVGWVWDGRHLHAVGPDDVAIE